MQIKLSYMNVSEAKDGYKDGYKDGICLKNIEWINTPLKMLR